jgi:hypothetical protein
MVTWPYLSLYVNGCRQNQHNDSLNGRFGFVFSLTKDERKTTGGETLLWREIDYFGSLFHRPHAGEAFYEAISPNFNRLLVFDDRLPHAVQGVEGVMDPLEGRFVLHGHISEQGPIVDGALEPETVINVMNEVSRRYSERRLGDDLPRTGGLPGSYSRDGSVGAVEIMLDQCGSYRVTLGLAYGRQRRISKTAFPRADDRQT